MTGGELHINVSEESIPESASPWLLAFSRDLQSPGSSVLAERSGDGFAYSIRAGDSAVWLLVRWPSGGGTAFRLTYSAGGDCIASVEKAEEDSIELQVRCSMGVYHVSITLHIGREPGVHWKTTLTPFRDLSIPYWPRDMFPLDEYDDPMNTRGIVHTDERKANGEILFFTQTYPASGTIFYFQNFTSLNPYFERTHTAPSGAVGGRWPELGFSLPVVDGSPLPEGEPIVIADAIVRFSTDLPETDGEIARLFLDMYADIYLAIPRPPTMHRDWTRRIDETVRDLTHSPECSVRIDGQRYLRAYVGADDQPPESMVQLAVLVPLVEYSQASGTSFPLIDDLKATLPAFFDKALGTIVRWLPGAEDMISGKEEHQGSTIMDSWYLYHTCLNLSRLASLGDGSARTLFLDSAPYCIRVAQHFRYHWPVFYDLQSLEPVKAETRPGRGGEHDVAAQYAHVMLQAYDLSGNEYYLDEARNAVETLDGLGFRLGYQFNNTSFGAGALLRLWRETGKEIYRELSHVCLANIFRNVWLWECNYGHAKHYHTFMGVAPLQNANYLALFEELEILAAFHEYIRLAGDDILPSLRILLPEYCKYLIDRAWYHYPSEVPEELLSHETKSGRLNRYLSIPLEDMYEGWSKAGQVGQEIYGAAAPFVFFTRHTHTIDGLNFRMHCDYPISDKVIDCDRGNPMKRGRMSFHIRGDRRCRSMVRLLPDDYTAMPETVLSIEGRNGNRIVKGKLSEFGYLEYDVPGNATVLLEWGVRARLAQAHELGSATGTAANNGHPGKRKPHAKMNLSGKERAGRGPDRRRRQA